MGASRSPLRRMLLFGCFCESVLAGLISPYWNIQSVNSIGVLTREDGTTCCMLLKSALGDKVISQGSSSNSEFFGLYWSKQEQELQPSCVVQAKSSDDVATAVSILATQNANGNTPSDCKFAVRGGGYSPHAGTANINNGVVIDLSSLKDISFSSDKSYLSVGAGVTWTEVYKFLEASGTNLGVAGGRYGDVGAVGMALGGGLSFFSPKIGWSCDTVRSYQIVLASGAAELSSASSNPSLFTAVKGTTSNYGIITRMDFDTFPSGPVWTGETFNPIEAKDAELKAFTSFSALSDSTFDPYASASQSYIYDADQQSWSIKNRIVYTKPNGGPSQSIPSVFQNLTSIQPEIASNYGMANLSIETTRASGATPLEKQLQPGRRQTWVTLTYKNSFDFSSRLFDITDSTMKALSAVGGAGGGMTLDPISKSMLKTSFNSKNGKSMIDIDQSRGPLVMAWLHLTWDASSDSMTVESAAKDWYDKATAAAKELNVADQFIFLNQAAAWQDPIGSYGLNVGYGMRLVQNWYDPRLLYQTAMPGGYKIPTGL